MSRRRGWWVVVVTRTAGRGDVERRFGPFVSHEAALKARDRPPISDLLVKRDGVEAWSYSVEDSP